MLDVTASTPVAPTMNAGPADDQHPTRMVYVLPAELERARDLPIATHLDSEGVTSKVYNCCY
jgi:hypothetical protein